MIARPVAVVTGGSSGIGRSLALELRRTGWSVQLLGANAERLAAAGRSLEAIPGPSLPPPLLADLSEWEGLHRAGALLRSRHPRLTLLVNNAGALVLRPRRNRSGVELTWALNTLAPHYLIHALLANLRAAAPARVINIASTAHRHASWRPGDEDGPLRGSGYGRYARSKQALILLTQEWARRIPADEIGFFSVHPGLVASRFGRNNPGLPGRLVSIATRLGGLSPDRAARPIAALAGDRRMLGRTGLYFSRGREVHAAPRSYDRALAARVWDSLEHQLEPLGRLGGS